MNQFVYSFLTDYANNPDPQFAVMLKGKWGCGKTHFIKRWLKEYKDENSGIEEESIDLKPIYVSLYGMTSIAEIKTAIDREVNPFFYSKTGKAIKGVAKILGKVVLKTNFDFNGDEKDDATFTGSLDSLSVFKKSNEDVIKGIRFIVFDDIERCQVEMKPLLGFINYFVEHCDCKVVVIGDDSHLSEENKKVLNEFKEKTVGREFEIKPDDEEAVDSFLDEPHISDYLKIERDYILKCFRSTGSDNLRVLRQCLMDFSEQIKEVKFGKKREQNAFLHGFLSSFIAVYAELNNKETQEYIEDFANFFQTAAGYLDSEKGREFRKLNQKYYDVSLGNIYNVLSVEYVTIIVRHIRTGEPLRGFIQNNIKLKRKELSPWEKLPNFWQMSNEEFDVLYEEVSEALLQNKITLPYQIGTTIGYLGYIDAKGVKQLEKKVIAKIEANIKKRMDACTSLDELFQIRISLLQGINYVRLGNCESTAIDGIVLFIQNTFEKRKNQLPDLMQEALRSLSDDNVYKLSEIDEKSYPDHSCAYQLCSIFEKEDGKKLSESIGKLTNKGKNEFCTFLSKHYLFGAVLQGMDGRYGSDLPVLRIIKENMEEKRRTATGVDKLSYERLCVALDKAVRRCEGEHGALDY